MTTNAEEVSFLSGMEREPAKLCETTVEVGKKLFVLDGMLTRVLEKARMAMARPERGPDPDIESEDDDIRRLASIMERLAQRPPNNDYHEAHDDNSLKVIVVGCAIAILSAGIVGAFSLSSQFSELRAEFSEWKKATDHRLEQLERRP